MEKEQKSTARKKLDLDNYEEKETLFKTSAFLVHNHIRIICFEDDYAEAVMRIGDDSRNTHGAVHGGAYLTLADIAAGAAAGSDGRSYVTQQLNANFIRSADNGYILGRGRVVHRGKKTCVVQFEIVNDEDEICSNGTAIFYCVAG